MKGKRIPTDSRFPGSYRICISENYLHYTIQISVLNKNKSKSAEFKGSSGFIDKFGLASFAAEQRSREIGMRKAMGSKIATVILLLSREYALLVIVSCIIGFNFVFFSQT